MLIWSVLYGTGGFICLLVRSHIQFADAGSDQIKGLFDPSAVVVIISVVGVKEHTYCVNCCTIIISLSNLSFLP